MDVHGDLNMRGNKLVQAGFKLETNFPSSPTPGSTVFKDDTLYFCTQIVGGLPVWVPLTKTIEMVRIAVPVPALEWTLPHNLQTNMPFVQIYDANGRWILPDSINSSLVSQVTVAFGLPTAGTAILQRGSTEGSVPVVVAYTQSFNNLSTWVVDHSLGYNPITRVMIGTNEVQPQSIVHNSVMRLTVTFSSPQSGVVRCI